MRTFVSILFFLLMLTQLFSLWMMDGAYRLNKTYVANNLCINQNKPQLHCDGKCFLSKQVAKNANSDAQPASSKKQQSEAFVCVLPGAFFIAFQYHQNIVLYSYAAAGSLTGYAPSLFQPPRSFFV